VPRGRKPSHAREEFIEAAIAYADEHGLAALTLRALGTSLGVSATAIYRYFPDKDALIVGIREALLQAAIGGIAGDLDPRDLILQTSLGYRRTARAHPCLSQVMTLPVTTGEAAMAVPVVMGGALVALGLKGDQVALAYRQLESFVVGSSAFDFSSAPNHLRERLQRMQLVTGTDVAYGLESPEAVDRLNEQAFETTVRALLDSFASRAKPESRS
jgi:AcrR family transcriptional regulator